MNLKKQNKTNKEVATSISTPNWFYVPIRYGIALHTHVTCTRVWFCNAKTFKYNIWSIWFAIGWYSQYCSKKTICICYLELLTLKKIK